MYPFYVQHSGANVSAPLLGAKSAQGTVASPSTLLGKGGMGYRVAELHRSARRMGKIKSQNSGRILKGEIENYRTGDAKKTLEQERRASDQRNGLGKKPKQGCNGDGQESKVVCLEEQKFSSLKSSLPCCVTQTSTRDGKNMVHSILLNAPNPAMGQLWKSASAALLPSSWQHFPMPAKLRLTASLCNSY